jgi:hypothetical protein
VQAGPLSSQEFGSTVKQIMDNEHFHRETPQGVVALDFAKALAAGDFSRAWGMLSKKLRSELSEEDLGARYRRMIASSGWEGPARIVDVTFTLDEYWDQQEDDIGWAYAAIAGDH